MIMNISPMCERIIMRICKSHTLLLILATVICPGYALAQVNSFCQARADSLYCKIPALFGDAVVNPLQPLDESLGTQLTLEPLASPASGIVYTKNPATKLPVAAGTETFGPVLSERGETLYEKKLFIAFTAQRYRINSLDGINLKTVPMIFSFCTPAGQCGPIAAIVRTDAHLDQFAVFGTYGINSWLDVSVAVPILKVSVSASGVSCVQPYCSFTTPGGVTVSFQSTEVAGSATGIGDIVLRAKASVFESHKFKLAVGADVRIATGNPLNFLGAGSTGVKPFEALSRSGRFSPHLNVAYQWNGDSLLAGAIAGEKGQMPEVFSYVGGADVAASKRLTFSADFLGEHVINVARLGRTTSLGLPNIALAQGTFNAQRGALGFKWKPVKEILISGNVLAKFDHNGAHYSPVPFAGISYTF
jgi:hypothetical protein